MKYVKILENFKGEDWIDKMKEADDFDQNPTESDNMTLTSSNQRQRVGKANSLTSLMSQTFAQK